MSILSQTRRSNLMGTEFSIYDGGENPKKAHNPNLVRENLGVITYVKKVPSLPYAL
jgi:hypothetical protein